MFYVVETSNGPAAELFYAHPLEEVYLETAPGSGVFEFKMVPQAIPVNGWLTTEWTRATIYGTRDEADTVRDALAALGYKVEVRSDLT